MLVLLAPLIIVLPRAASARPTTQKGVLIYASVREVGGAEPRPGTAADLFAIRADGSGFQRLTRTESWEEDPAWSPDRTRIAFSLADPWCHGGSCEWAPTSASVWVMEPDGRHSRALTSPDEANENDWIEESPTWSPDSKKVAFARSDSVDGRNSKNGIYVVGVDGHGLARISRAHAISLAWSPDGSTIAYVHESGRYVGLLDVATGRARRLRARALSRPCSVDWSPRGDFLAVTTGKALFIVRAAGGVARKVVEAPGANGVSWSGNGCCLAFDAARSGERSERSSDVYVVAVRGGRPRRLTGNRGWDYDPVWRP